ncbi:MAG: SPOR domain-containing protein [Gammaproteobacteria bacterium]
MDFLLKQRLVGAIVLVALGVIFIPMLLEEKIQPSIPPMQSIPAPETLPQYKRQESHNLKGTKVTLPPVSVLPAPVAEKKPQPQVAAVTKKTTIKKSDIQQSASKVIEKKKPLPPIQSKKFGKVVNKTNKVSEKKQPQTDIKTTGPKSWVIQVGSFSSQKNAFGLRDKLRKAGFVTQVHRFMLNEKATFRVRVGPFVNETDANKAIREISSKYSLTPKILRYPRS